jgi:hypothetical protein
MHKRFSIFVLVLAVLALSTGVAFAGPNGTDRPFKSNSIATSTINVATGTRRADWTVT